MRERRRRLLVTSGCLAGLPGLSRLPRLPRLRGRKWLPRNLRLTVALMLVCAVGCRAAGEFGRAAFLTRRRSSCEPGRLSRAAFPRCAAFPARAATTAVPAATTSAASAPLSTLSALSAGSLARKLTLLSAGLGAWLIARRLRRSAHRSLCGGTRVGVAIPLAPFVITVVVPASAAITPIVAASLGAPTIAVSAALTAFRTARLS